MDNGYAEKLTAAVERVAVALEVANLLKVLGDVTIRSDIKVRTVVEEAVDQSVKPFREALVKRHNANRD